MVLKLLLVEDKIDLQESIVEYLQTGVFSVQTASIFMDGEDKVSMYNYDCLIMDIIVDSGLDLVRLLK